MNEQGLAAQQAPLMGGSGMGNQQSVQMVQEVARMLMQGMNPQDLVAQGVPAEIVQAAIELVMAQQQQAPIEEAPVPRGLAQEMQRGMM